MIKLDREKTLEYVKNQINHQKDDGAIKQYFEDVALPELKKFDLNDEQYEAVLNLLIQTIGLNAQLFANLLVDISEITFEEATNQNPENQ